MNTIKAKQAIEAVALRHGLSFEEVKAQIQAAMDDAMKRTEQDPRA